jgi:phosphoribosylanthranilate isomerase
MKIKVCGMLSEDQCKALAAIGIDYIGFIFYHKSARFAGIEAPAWLAEVPNTTQKVGVFVNQDEVIIEQIGSHWCLDLIQLHGDESPEFCTHIKKLTTKQVIKSFGVDALFTLKNIEPYFNAIDYLLFDTKSPQYGGTGKPFDLSIIAKWQIPLPYFLSGGIGNDFKFTQLSMLSTLPFALDINSRFETKPGEKSIADIQHFLNLKNQHEHTLS